VGLPALRLSGLYLGVTTLAFALAVTSYFLNQQYYEWIPLERIERPPLLGRFDYDSPTGVYYLALGAFVITTLGVLGIRRSRTGRVLVALRENERGVQAYGVSVVRAKLTAFALSGFLAAVAGGLLVHHQQQFSLGLFPADENLVVFTAAVVGGLGSATGALLGAVFMKGGQWFLPGQYRMFASAIGVLLVLLALPGGLGGVWFRARDLWLRWVADRRQIVVPSLVADTKVVEQTAEAAFEERAAAMAASTTGDARPDGAAGLPVDGPDRDGGPKKKVVKKVKKKSPAAASTPGTDA
jgi:branched-chain amino acid transport system permease protein